MNNFSFLSFHRLSNVLATFLQSISIYGVFLGLFTTCYLVVITFKYFYSNGIEIFNKSIVSIITDLTDSYAHVENVIKICQAVSFLEIVHPMIGFTKGDWTSPLIQVRQFFLKSLFD